MDNEIFCFNSCCDFLFETRQKYSMYIVKMTMKYRMVGEAVGKGSKFICMNQTKHTTTSTVSDVKLLG